MRALLVIVLLSSSAWAEPVDDLTRTARSLARQGHCAGMRAVGNRVREIDADYFQRVFSVDPVIRACTQAMPDLALARDLPITDEKSRETAIGLSAGVFAAGVAAVVFATKAEGPAQTSLVLAGLAGIAIGPTLGHAYAGEAWNTGLKIRLASLATGSLGIVMVAKACPPFSACPDPRTGKFGAALFVTGTIGLAIGTIYEIFDAPGAATRSNERHLRLVPSVGPGVAGASLAGRF